MMAHGWEMEIDHINGPCRLDYQPLFGKGARAPPRKDGWTRERDIVDFHQSEACLPRSSRQIRQHKLFFSE